MKLCSGSNISATNDRFTYSHVDDRFCLYIKL